MWEQQPPSPPPQASFFVAMGFLFSLLIWRPGKATPDAGTKLVQYNIPMNTAIADSLPDPSNTTPCSFLLLPEDFKGTRAHIPLPKWRKEKLSCEGLQVTIRLRGRRLCGYWAGGEHAQRACAGTPSFWSTYKTPMDEEAPGSCGCAMTPASFPKLLREASGPALLAQYAGAGQKGGASGLQTDASAAARWGVPPYHGCAGAGSPAVTAVARG